MTIDDSLERILRRREIVADLFYTIFLAEFPEVQEYFKGVNLKRQAVLLTMALQVVKQHCTSEYPTAELYLKVLGHKHREWGIPEDTYSMFRDALLMTLERFHGDLWDGDLHRQWKEAIEKASATMLEGYDESFSL